ncbi:MAG: hypothetical protein ACOYOJ_03790 [Alsobacter sp.]|jgi:hypothetical protein
MSRLINRSLHRRDISRMIDVVLMAGVTAVAAVQVALQVAIAA